MKKKSHKKGFTLIELLIYIGLMGIIIGGVSSLLFIMLNARVKNQTIAEVEQQGTQAMKLMTQTIRNAEAITAPGSGAAATLTLDVVDVADDPTVFDLSGTALQITQGASTPVPLTSSRVDVSAMTFSNLSKAGTAGNIQIQFTLSYASTSGSNAYSFSKTFTSSASLR